MKNSFTIFIIFAFIFSTNYCQGIKNILPDKITSDRNNIDSAYAIDKLVYKTYHKVHYKELPLEIKRLMKNSGCGEIGANPSQQNDYKTNYDSGYKIDLNDDGKPEYLFSCQAPPHGAGDGKIYSFLDKHWRIICESFPIYENSNKEINITILKSKNEGFHDLLSSDIRTDRKVIIRYIKGTYYDIYYAKEAVDDLLFFMVHETNNYNNCYIGISNMPEIEIKKRLSNSENKYFICALESDKDAQEVKNQLIEKGFNFIKECNLGQIVFCFSH